MKSVVIIVNHILFFTMIEWFAQNGFQSAFDNGLIECERNANRLIYTFDESLNSRMMLFRLKFG